LPTQAVGSIVDALSNSQIVLATGPQCVLTQLPVSYDEMKQAMLALSQQILLEQQQAEIMAKMIMMVPQQQANMQMPQMQMR
jgi:hypothetical protein